MGSYDSGIVSEETAAQAAKRDAWNNSIPGAAGGGEVFDAFYNPTTGDVDFSMTEPQGPFDDGAFPSAVEIEAAWAFGEMEQEEKQRQFQAMRELFYPD